MAITGDEGRVSLRKAMGSWQKSFDPSISEWGNPTLHKWLSARKRQKPPESKGLVVRVICEGSTHTEYIGVGSEPGELKHLSSRRKRNQPRFPK